MVVPHLIAALTDFSAWRRRFAQATIARIGQPAVWPLVNVLGAKDPRLSTAAAMALVQVGDIAVPALIEAIQHEDLRIVIYSALALGDIGDNRALPWLEWLRDSSDERVQRAASKALSRFTTD